MTAKAVEVAHRELEAWRGKVGAAPLADVCPVRGVLDKLGDKWSRLSPADQNGDQKLSPDELKAAFESGKIKPMGFGKGRGKPHK